MGRTTPPSFFSKVREDVSHYFLRNFAGSAELSGVRRAARREATGDPIGEEPLLLLLPRNQLLY